MRQLIETLTRTPITGILVGACVTAFIQSNSATAVMMVSFVDARLMTPTQAIGVTMGANIGTTITGQTPTIKVQDYTYPLITIGVLPSLFGRSKVQKHAGNGLLSFDLLFMGMQTTESSMSLLRNGKELFLMFSHNPLMGVLVGALLTLLTQPSAATVGLTTALDVQGPLSLYAAIPIILGDDIGTAIAAVLTSIDTGRTAKQVCVTHVLFNVIGACIFLTILPLYQELVAMTAMGIIHQIANARTLFNAFNIIILLPFVKPFMALIRRLLPDKTHKVVKGVQYLGPKLIETTPGITVGVIKNGCTYVGFLVVHLLDSVQEVFFNGKKDSIPKIEEIETKIDQLHETVKAYAEDVTQAGVSDDAARILTLYVASSRNIRHIGDYGKKLLEYYAHHQNRPRDFSQQTMTELSGMYAEAYHAIMAALDGFINNNPNKAHEVVPIAGKLCGLEVGLRSRHIQRLGKQECDSETDLVYADILGTIECIDYHSNNVVKTTIPSYTVEHKAKA